MPERTALYRLFGADDELLYVGVSKQFGKRWQDETYSKPWWPEVRRQTIDWHETRVAALKAEAEAIATERPRHNLIAGFASAGRGKTPVRNIRVADEIWRTVQAKAASEGRTVTDVIVSGLRAYIA